jgi:glycosyl transferase family 87
LASTSAAPASGRRGAGVAALGCRLRLALDGLIDTDFTAGRSAIALGVIYIAVRLPWLGTGYGAETDAYRVALSGLHLWRDGEYLPSRLPGYPLHDLLMAPLVQIGGSVATNLATVIASLMGVLIFARILRALASPVRGLLVIAFAFTPFLIVNSVQTKDYPWALTLLLGAYLASLKRQSVLSGLLLGLGAGCRITTGLFAVPLLLLYVDRRSWRGALSFLTAFALTGFAVFLPVTLQYGRGFLAYADSRISPDIVIRSIGQYSIGALGALATVVALLCSWRRLIALPAALRSNVQLRIWILTVLLYTALFLRLPIDIAYLIPIYPFGFLLLGQVVNRFLLAGVVAMILFSGLIDLDISAMHNLNMATFVRTARPCRSCAELFHDRHVRSLYVDYATELGRTPLPPHTVVLTGGAFPDFAVISWDRFHYEIVDPYRPSISMLSDDGAMHDQSGDVYYLADPDRPDLVLGRFREAGYQLLKADPEGPAWHVRLAPLR